MRIVITLLIGLSLALPLAAAPAASQQPTSPAQVRGFDPQPEPPANGYVHPAARAGFNPQPDPPGSTRGFNPQPEPPPAVNGFVHPAQLKGFNPQPEPPAVQH
ncbi:MAG: hypothetical protein AB7S38_38690 [Vulcanimicrobiota bacterium]